ELGCIRASLVYPSFEHGGRTSAPRCRCGNRPAALSQLGDKRLSGAFRDRILIGSFARMHSQSPELVALLLLAARSYRLIHSSTPPASSRESNRAGGACLGCTHAASNTYARELLCHRVLVCPLRSFLSVSCRLRDDCGHNACTCSN